MIEAIGWMLWMALFFWLGVALGWAVDHRRTITGRFKQRFRPQKITNDPDDWVEVGFMMWQNRKEDGDAFSDDRGETYWLLSEGAHSRRRIPRHESVKVVDRSIPENVVRGTE